MFGKSKNSGEKPKNSSRGISWEIPCVQFFRGPQMVNVGRVTREITIANIRGFHNSILFGIIFALSVAELIFTIDAFIYLERKHKWWSSTERARMGFLIFSCARTIFLSAIYTVTHCKRVKNLMSTMHTVCIVFGIFFSAFPNSSLLPRFAVDQLSQRGPRRILHSARSPHSPRSTR